LENIYANTFAKASLRMQEAMYQSTRLNIISQVSSALLYASGQKRAMEGSKRNIFMI